MKKKSTLLSLMALSSLVIAGAAVFINSYESELRYKKTSGDKAFDIDTSSIENKETYLEGVANDDKGNSVKTRFYNMEYDAGILSFAGQRDGYFTNADPIKGIEDIAIYFTFPSDIALDMYVVVYGSYNPIVFTDIFAGKYIDLTFFACRDQLDSGYSSHMIRYSDYGGASLEDCRYFLFYIANMCTADLVVDKLSFSAVCSTEPPEKEVGQRTDYKEREQMTSDGLPEYTPFIGTNGYIYSYNPLFPDMGQSIWAVANQDALNTFIGELCMSQGYEMIPNYDYTDGVYRYYLQKDISDYVDTFILLFAPFNDMNYAMVGITHSTAWPDMRIPTYDSWPTSEIAKISMNLSITYPALNLSGAKYTINASNTYESQAEVIISIKNFGANVDDELTTYLGALDSSYSYESTSTGSTTRYLIYKGEGQYLMQIVKNSVEITVTLVEHFIFDHFPASKRNIDNGEIGYSLPESLDDIEGTFMFDQADKFRGTFDGSHTFEDLKTAFVDAGFYIEGNEQKGSFVPKYRSLDKAFARLKVDYTMMSSDSYFFQIRDCSVMEGLSFKAACHQLDDFYDEEYLDPLDSVEFDNVNVYNFTSHYRFGFIPGAKEDQIDDIYNAIDVDPSLKSRTGNLIQFAGTNGAYYVQYNLNFTEEDGGLYVYLTRTTSNGALAAFINEDAAHAGLNNPSKALALPECNYYQPQGTFSLLVHVAKEEELALKEEYVQTLLAAGYTYNRCSDVYLSPDDTLYDVKIHAEINYLEIAFSNDYSDESKFKTFAELDLSVISFASEFSPYFDFFHTMYSVFSYDEESITFNVDPQYLITIDYREYLLDNGFTRTERNIDRYWNPFYTLTKKSTDGEHIIVIFVDFGENVVRLTVDYRDYK